MMYPLAWRFCLAILGAIFFSGRIDAATFLVTNALSTGAGSFRQALVAANSLPGLDTIQFNIPGSGVRVISPFNDWPSITDSVVIDATTQPGYSNSPLVMIVGGFGPSTGLMISANNCVVRGLCVAGFSSTGIYIFGASNTIAGCFVGIDAGGVTARGNHIGILVSGGMANMIGGANPGDRNVVSANVDLGVCLLYSTADIVQGNFIGTDKSGKTSLPNGNDGVSVDHSSDCAIGGSSLRGEGNLISGNGAAGIRVLESPATANVIQGNIVGADFTITSSLPNGSGGIIVANAPGNTIGGSEPGRANVISGNLGNGILIQGVTADGNVVEGNIIGLDFTLGKPLANYLNGVAIVDAINSTIGGQEPGSGNLISGNRLYGISLGGSNNVVQGNFVGFDGSATKSVPNGLDSLSGGGVLLSGLNATLGGDLTTPNFISGNRHDGVRLEGAVGSVLRANWIGLTPFGEVLGNQGNGISISSSRQSTIGGNAFGAGNVCSGNGLAGILLTGSGSVENVIVGNKVGTDPEGRLPRPNGAAGVELSGGARTNVIGGTAPGAPNRIAFNLSDGVLVRDSGTIGATISGNSIFANGGLAINLRPAGEATHKITPNDVSDSDTGPNQLQNSPAITNVTYAFGLTVISGFLRSQPAHNYRIELFRNDPYSGSVFGQGQTFLGTISVTADAAGLAEFQFTYSATWDDQWFAATARDIDTGDTSEFSAAVPVLSGLLRITELRPSGSGALITFLTETNRHYAVQWTASLPAVSWLDVPAADNVPGTGLPVTVSDPLSSNASQRFYRITQLQ
jgi:hypothetical protein